MCFPGAEIPEWFNFICDGSSVNMKLEEGWYNSNFMGFALCFIFTTGTNKEPGYLQCRMSFKPKLDEDEIAQNEIPLYMTVEEGAINEHVVMQSVHVDYRDVSSAVEVTFDFHYHSRISSCEFVKKCGIRMLYLQDAMEFFNSNRQHIPRESHDNPEPSKRITIDFDTDKPHQKRSKLF